MIKPIVEKAQSVQNGTFILKEYMEGHYELLTGTKVQVFTDYNKAKKVAEKLGLKEAEYGDEFNGFSYCIWNASGDRNEDEQVVAYYKFKDGKPVPLSDFEAEQVFDNHEIQYGKLEEALAGATTKVHANRLTEDADAQGGADASVDSPEQAVAELKDKTDFDAFVRLLDNDTKSAAFLKFLMDHYQTGDDKIGAIKSTKVTDKQIPCKQLIPTQNEISLSKSLGMLNNTSFATAMMDGKLKDPCIIYADKYIIDGHHRWSKVYALAGPDATIPCKVFDAIPGVTVSDMLKATQLAIVTVSKGDVKLLNPVDSDNMLTMPTDKIKDFILKVISDEVVKAYDQRFKCGDTKEACADRMVKNVAVMQQNNKPISGASDREVMPQTDRAPGSIEKMADGIIDLTEASEYIKSLSKSQLIEMINMYKKSVTESVDTDAAEKEAKNTVIKEWYKETFPSDSLGEDLIDGFTFYDLFTDLDSHHFDESVIAYDSVVRGRVFEKLAKIMGVPYDEVYEQWLDSTPIYR